jgi:hypothetical protein
VSPVDGERQLVDRIEQQRAGTEVNLGRKRAGLHEDPEVVRQRRESAEGDLARLTSWPVHPLPAFVRERLPDLDLDDPSTWPEPDRCTDGRPWGHNAYSFGYARESDLADRWRSWFAWRSATESGTRWSGTAKPCRNRWKYEESRLCGTHHRPWEDSVRRERQSARRYARIEQHLDLAKRLAAHGIEADGSSNTGVVLQADAVETLLQRLALLAGAIPPGVWPSTDLSVPPPL